MAEIYDYDVAANNNNSAAPDGFPENMQYSQVNDAAREVMAVVARYIQAIGAVTTAGTGNDYTLTISQAVATGNGRQYLFKADRANTGNVTLNINATGANSVLLADQEEISPGQISVGGIYLVVDDGTNYILVGVLSGGQISSLINVGPNANGANVIDPAASSPTINLVNNSDVIQGVIRSTATETSLRAQSTSAVVLLEAINLGAATHTVFRGDPDADASLYHNNTQVAVTDTVANGGFRINNQSTGSGLERALSVSDLPVCLFKPGSTARSNTAIRSDDPDLIYAITDTEDYYLEGVLFYNATNAAFNGDFNFGIHYSGTLDNNRTFVTREYFNDRNDVISPDRHGVLNASGIELGSGITSTVSTSSFVRAIKFTGILGLSTTGTLSIQWAQNTINNNATTLQRGSFFRLARC